MCLEGRLCFPFYLTWLGRVGLPPHNLCSPRSQVLALRTILDLHRNHCLETPPRSRHSPKQIESLLSRHASFQDRHASLPSHLPPWGQVPRDACTLHTFAINFSSSCSPGLEDSLPSPPFLNSLKGQSNTHFIHASFHD